MIRFFKQNKTNISKKNVETNLLKVLCSFYCIFWWQRPKNIYVHSEGDWSEVISRISQNSSAQIREMSSLLHLTYFT